MSLWPHRRLRVDSIWRTRATCSRHSTLAIVGCQDGRYDAIVTAPVQKSVINDAGVPFSGHTEYLAEHTGTPAS